LLIVGSHVKGLLRQADLLPTIADIIGLELHGGSPLRNGQNLLTSSGHRYSPHPGSLLVRYEHSNESRVDRCLISHSMFNAAQVFSVRCGPIRAIFDAFIGTFAFDIHTDPHEHNNLLHPPQSNENDIDNGISWSSLSSSIAVTLIERQSYSATDADRSLSNSMTTINKDKADATNGDTIDQQQRYELLLQLIHVWYEHGVMMQSDNRLVHQMARGV
jgi:hypothetical protein